MQHVGCVSSTFVFCLHARFSVAGRCLAAFVAVDDDCEDGDGKTTRSFQVGTVSTMEASSESHRNCSLGSLGRDFRSFLFDYTAMHFGARAF